jgi:hypothetical protein
MPAILVHSPPDVIVPQEDASPHYAVQVLLFLDHQFHQSWNGFDMRRNLPTPSCSFDDDAITKLMVSIFNND